MTKRIFALLLALSMVLGLFAGCGAKEEPAATPTEAPASAEKADSPAENYKYGKVHGVTFTYGQKADADNTAELELQAGRTAQYLADTGNTAEYVEFSYDYTAIGAMFEGGQMPDTFHVANSEPQKLIANGWGRDITACIEAVGINLDDFNDGLLSIYSTENGEIWGLPKFAYTMAIVGNASVFREAGLVNADGTYMIPKTWAEVIEFGEIINEKTGKGGFAMTAIDGMGGWYWTAMALSFGADLCVRNDDGSYTARLNTPEAIEAMEFFQDLYASSAAYGDPTIDSADDCQDQLAAGNVGMVFGGSDNPANYTDITNRAMNPEDIILIPMPVSTSPEKYLCYTGGDGIWFSPDATDEEVIAALEFYMNFGILSGWNEEIEAAYRTEMDAKVNTNNRIELPSYPVYNDDSYQAKVEVLKTDYMNHFDYDKQFGYFFDYVNSANVSYEEDGDMQNMFRIVVAAIQEIYVNEDADVAALMEDANAQYQSLLDAMN